MSLKFVTHFPAKLTSISDQQFLSFFVTRIHAHTHTHEQTPIITVVIITFSDIPTTVALPIL